MQHFDTDLEIQRGSETLMLKEMVRWWWSEEQSRARTHYPGDPVTLTCIWLRSTAARKIMAFARLWNSLPICRDFSKVVLLWSTSLAYRIYKHSFNSPVKLQFSYILMHNLAQRLFLEQFLVLSKKGNMVGVIQGKGLNDQEREMWIINIIQGIVTKIS